MGVAATGLIAYAFSPKFRELVSKATGGRVGGHGEKKSYPAQMMSLPRGPQMPMRTSPSMQAHEGLAPGGAARNTLPGVLNTTKFQGKVLNRFGR